MEFHFNTNRAEAERWLSTAVKLLTTRDLHGTKSFAIRARESDPRLEATEQIIAVADTLLAGDMRINNYHQPDWYAILQLAQYSQNLELVATQYRRLALLLNPHRNRFPYADQAFQLVSEAWNVLSNPSKKAFYDNELSMYSQFDSAPSGSTQLFERQFLQMHHVQQQQPPQPQQPPQQHFQPQQLPQHFYHPPAPSPPQELQRPQQFHLQQPPQQQKQQFMRPPQQEEQLQPQFLRPLQPEDQHRQQPQPQFLRPLQPEEQQKQQPQPQFLRPPQLKEQQRPQPQQQFLRSSPQLEEQQQYLRPPQQEEQQQRQQQFLRPLEPEEQQHKKLPVREIPKRKDGRSAMEVDKPIENNVTESTPPPAESSLPAYTAAPSEPVAPSESTKLVSASESGNFWTACPYCYNLYEYPNVYEECMLRCQSCKRGFSAVAIESPPVIGTNNVVNFCCWGYFPLGFEEKGKDTEGSAGWTPFSTMFACPIQGKKNVGRVKSANSGPRVYYDDEEALIDISDPSEDSDDEEWQKAERNKRAVKAKGKAPGPKSRAKIPVRASSRINKVNQNGSVQEKVGSGASVGGESVPKVSKAEPSKKAGASRKRGAAELGKLDLNVEFSNNEGEEHAAQAVSQRNGTANGTEDNIEGIGFFEGLDEFFSSLPILNVVADDKVKAN